METREGLRLHNAIFIYAQDPDARMVRSRWQDRATLSPGTRAELDSALTHLKADLRLKLRLGELRLGGFKAGEEMMRFPDFHWCTTADFDLDTDSATAHGLTLLDVRIFLIGQADCSGPYHLAPTHVTAGIAQVTPLTSAKLTKPRASKGTAPGTLQAIRAMAAVVYGDSKFPRKALPLAKKAAERAQELGMPGADALNPDGFIMREIAAEFIKGIEAAERPD